MSNTMLETLETRTLMSASMETTFGADAPEPTALLLPAIQAAREAARKSSTSSAHSGGVNVLWADGSVRNVGGGGQFAGGAVVGLADGSVR